MHIERYIDEYDKSQNLDICDIEHEYARGVNLLFGLSADETRLEIVLADGEHCVDVILGPDLIREVADWITGLAVLPVPASNFNNLTGEREWRLR